MGHGVGPDYAIVELRRRAAPPAPPAAPKHRARAYRLDVPFDEHRAVLAGRAAGRLDYSRPVWSVGELVAVNTATTPTDRRSEEPTRMTVTAVTPVTVGELQAPHARSIGLRLATEVQRLALRLPAEASASLVNMSARGSQQTVWLTAWTRVEHDTVRLVRDAGWQAPSGPLQWRPIDAGEAVDPDYQRDLTGAAQPGINAATARAAAMNARRISTTKAKTNVAHRLSTQRRRIETARKRESMTWPDAPLT